MDIKINKNIGDYYIVSFWTTCWVLLSKHKYKSDAESIKSLLKKSLSVSKAINEVNKLLK
jgi:hypothetical protein